jgi:hypothetical protein
MRRRELVLGGLAAAVPLVPSPARERPAPIPLDEFVGVNTHVEYTDGAYADAAATVERLKWLGLRHVRNNAPNPASHGQANFAPLIQAGMRFSLVCWLEPKAQLEAIKARFPSAAAIALLEGPNELNNNPGFRYGDKTGPAAGPGYMADLKSALAADPFFRGVPTAGVVSFPTIATPADLANVHSYPKRGARPRGQLRADIGAQRRKEPGRPVVVTEAGYNSEETSEADQARLTVDLIETARDLGVVRLYLYELLDDRPDNHWGLFRIDGSAKPAAEAVRKLLKG